MKRIMIVSLLTLLAFGLNDRAMAWILIDARSPQVTGVSQASVDAAVQNVLRDVRAELLKYQSQKKLARGLANASAYSAHAATQRGYQGYDIVAVTVGTMAGAHLPAFEIGYYKDLSKKLRYKGDLDAGAALVPWSLQVGLHLGHFNSKLDGLYVAGKFGYVPFTYEDYKVRGLNTGVAINYQIFKKVKAGYQVFVWRGVSVGTGLYYQRNDLVMKHNLGYHSDTIGGSPLQRYLVEPQFKFNIFTQSYVVPLEASTSIRLLWVLNLSVGGGIDFAIGESHIKARGHTWAYILDLTGGITTTSPGFALVYGEQKGTMGKWWLPKVTAGVGFSFGPVVIDVPVTYYFIKGFGVGLSLGFEW